MKAIKIKMKQGSFHSDSLLEIDEIYLTGCENEGYFKKHILYNYLKENPGTIQVNIYPYPNLKPALSVNNEKYVRSEGNNIALDNLLQLPRE